MSTGEISPLSQSLAGRESEASLLHVQPKIANPSCAIATFESDKLCFRDDVKLLKNGVCVVLKTTVFVHLCLFCHLSLSCRVFVNFKSSRVSKIWFDNSVLRNTQFILCFKWIACVTPNHIHVTRVYDV